MRKLESWVATFLAEVAANGNKVPAKYELCIDAIIGILELVEVFGSQILNTKISAILVILKAL